ncbi:681_t:CDS:1, partial [Funneliformis geosporum]
GSLRNIGLPDGLALLPMAIFLLYLHNPSSTLAELMAIIITL